MENGVRRMGLCVFRRVRTSLRARPCVSETPISEKPRKRPNTRATLSPNATMPETTVNQGTNGQFKTTVPKGLAEAMDLDGKRIDWRVKSGSTLEVTVIDE